MRLPSFMALMCLCCGVLCLKTVCKGQPRSRLSYGQSCSLNILSPLINGTVKAKHVIRVCDSLGKYPGPIDACFCLKECSLNSCSFPVPERIGYHSWILKSVTVLSNSSTSDQLLKGSSQRFLRPIQLVLQTRRGKHWVGFQKYFL